MLLFFINQNFKWNLLLFWNFFSLLFLIESEPISTSYISVFRETCDDVILKNKRSHGDMINKSIKYKKSLFLTSFTIFIFYKTHIFQISLPPPPPFSHNFYEYHCTTTACNNIIISINESHGTMANFQNSPKSW